MFKYPAIILAVSLALPLFAADSLLAQASEAQQVFDSLYGTKVKAALATRDLADDQTLASELLVAARNATSSPALVALLCEQAHKLAAGDVKGYDVAVEALRLIASTDETKYIASMESIIDLRRKQFGRAKADERASLAQMLTSEMVELAAHKANAGDHQAAALLYRQALAVARQNKLPDAENIRLLAEQAASHQQLKDRIDLLRTKLLQTADKVTATELVMIHIVDLDSPKEASKFTDRCGDDQLKARVALAAGDAGALTDAQALDLATWYRSLSVKAQGKALANTLVRAAKYYQHYLAVHTASDVQRTGAELAMQDVIKAIEALGPLAKVPERVANTGTAKPATDTAVVGPDGIKLSPVPMNKPWPYDEWVEILPLVDLKKHAARGRWSLKDKMLTLPAGEKDATFYVPVHIDGDYEIVVVVQYGAEQGVVTTYLPTPANGMLSGSLELEAKAGTNSSDHYLIEKVQDVARVTRTSGNYKPSSHLLDKKELYAVVKDLPRGLKVPGFQVRDISFSISSIRIKLRNGDAAVIQSR